MQVKLNAFISALDGDKWPASRCRHYTREVPSGSEAVLAAKLA